MKKYVAGLMLVLGLFVFAPAFSQTSAQTSGKTSVQAPQVDSADLIAKLQAQINDLLAQIAKLKQSPSDSNAGGSTVTVNGQSYSYGPMNTPNTNPPTTNSPGTGDGSVAYEQVKCVFAGATSEQKCHAVPDNSPFSCSGTSACVVDVKGLKGTNQIWKSTCGGYAYTTIDGNSEYAKFDCSGAPKNDFPQDKPTSNDQLSLKYVQAPAEDQNVIHPGEKTVVVGANLDSDDIYVGIIGKDRDYKAATYAPTSGSIYFTVPNITDGEYDLFLYRSRTGEMSNRIQVKVLNAHFPTKEGTKKDDKPKDSKMSVDHVNQALAQNILIVGGRSIVYGKGLSANGILVRLSGPNGLLRGASAFSPNVNHENSIEFIVPILPEGDYNLYLEQSNQTSNSIQVKVKNPTGLVAYDGRDNPDNWSMTLISPNRGDIWKVGNTYTIKLKTVGNIGPKAAFLVDSTNPSLYHYVGGSLSANEFKYVVSKDVSPVGKYILVVCGENYCPAFGGSSSAEISVSENGNLPKNSKSAIDIKSVSVNGNWQVGQTYSVKWNADPTIGTKTIHLVGDIGGVKVDKYLGSTNNDQFSYTVSPMISPAGSYSLWVCGRYCPYDGGIGSSKPVSIEQ